MPTHTFTTTWQRGGGGGADTVAKTASYTADGEKNADLTVLNGVVNQLVSIAWVLANLKSFLITSDVDVTVKTNSSSAPQETLAVKANNPIVFRNDDGRAALFAGNVTALYVTNAAGATATINIRALEDVTP